MAIPNFLNTEETVVIPEGGDFVPSGLIGLWRAQVLYRLWSPTEVPEELQENGVIVPAGSGFMCYYFDWEWAGNVASELDLYNPNAVWHFETQTDSVLNFGSDEARQAFGPGINYDVRIVTLRSNKYRHALHMIALPAAVNAMARALGYLPADNRYDFSELQTSDDTVFNDQFQFNMIGHPDAEPGEDDYYTESVLWKRRASLWRALGEEDASKFQLKDSGKKFATESDKLSQCLGILHNPWSNDAWLRIVTVANPRVDAVSNSGNRLNIPTIGDIFEDENAAKEAAEKDLARRESFSEGSDDSDTGEGPGPQLPATWAEMELSVDDWTSALAEAKEGVDGTFTPPKAKRIAKDLDATVDDVKAWWDEV